MKKLLALLLCALLLFVPVYGEENVSDEAVEETEEVEETIEETEESEPEDTGLDIFIEEDFNHEEFVGEDHSGNIIKVPDGITVTLNGEIVKFDAAQPKFSGNRVLVPMRKIFETFGAEVFWNGEKKEVMAKSNDVSISLTVGKKEAYINDKLFLLDTPADVFYGRTYVPVRFISESLGAKVSWDSERKTVLINTEK